MLTAFPPRHAGAYSVFRGSKETMHDLRRGVEDHGGGPRAQEHAWGLPRGDGDRVKIWGKRRSQLPRWLREPTGDTIRGK